MDVSSFSRQSLAAGARYFSGNFGKRKEKRSDRHGRGRKIGLWCSMLRHGRAESLKSNSTVLERERTIRLSGPRKQRSVLDINEVSKLDKRPVWRSTKAEQESKEKKGDEQTKMTKNEQTNQLQKGEDGPTAVTRVQIFSSTLFWVFMFFMASIWDRENSFRSGRRGDRNNRQ